eukprot:COSAG05_NODE_14705_length_390_cov_0.532646_1_plen_35_part_01
MRVDLSISTIYVDPGGWAKGISWPAWKYIDPYSLS